MLMEEKGVFGGGEWGMFSGFLVVERWLRGWCCYCWFRVEREGGEARERKALESLV